MKNTKLILLFSFLTFVFSEAGQAQMSEKWHKLNDLISAEIKAIQTIRPLSPRLGQRLIELHTERLELIKKQENQYFLNSSVEQRQKKSKRDFFIKSRNLMFKIRTLALKQIARFPQYIGNAEIYHTLALNSRDYGNSSDTEKYLKMALKKAPSNSSVIYQAQTSLAEHYYNEKKYKLAVHYYDQVLKNESDEWRSKHLFNASWCYLKIQNYGTAIALLMKSFEISKRPRMVSMQDQVMESAGAFFVMGERVQEGLDFYLENSKRATSHLLSMAKRVEESSGFDMTEHVLKTALNEAKQRQHKADTLQVQLQRLDTYRSFKKYERHEKTANEINQLYANLEPDEDVPGKQEAILKITELVGYFQIRLSKNAKIQQADYDPKLLKRIHNYFDILIDLNPPKSALYDYYKAESSFAVSRYEQASQLYKKALDKSIKLPQQKNVEHIEISNTELQKKVLNALLSILEYANLEKEKHDDLALYTYSNHISLWPIDEKSRLIYKSLFNLLFEKQKRDEAKKTMYLYADNYAQEKDRKIQRSMLTQLIDERIKNKDVNALAGWIKKLDQGLFNIQQDYIEKATVILGELLFETYKNLQTQGEFKKAIIGHQEIYEDKRYPKKIKADAALFLSQIFVQRGEYDEANKWIVAYFENATQDQIQGKLSTLYNFHITYAQGQDFKSSIKIADIIIDKFCHLDFKRKEDLYTNRVYFSYITGEDAKSYKYTKDVKRCPIFKKEKKNIKWQDKQLSGLVSNYRENKDWSLFLSYRKKFHRSTDFPLTQKTLASGLFSFYWDALMQQSEKQVQLALDFLNRTPKSIWTQQQVNEFESIQTFHKSLPIIENHTVSKFTDTKVFDEKLFNSELEKNAQDLEEISLKVDKVIETGVPEYMLFSSYLLNKHYLELAKNVRSFSPQGVPPEFVKSFKNAMAQLASGLERKALEQFERTKRTIQTSQSLSAYNYILHHDKFNTKSFNYRYMASEHVFPADDVTQKPERKVGQVKRGQP